MASLNRLLESLRRWGVLRSNIVEASLEELDWASLVPKAPGRVGYYFAPERRADGSLDLSPRTAVLLAELLEIAQGTRVALPTPRPRLLEALVRALGGKIYDRLRDAVAERSLEIAPAVRETPLVDDGFSLRVSFEPNEESLTKIIHHANGDVRLGLENLPLIPGQEPARQIRQLLVVEGFCRRALDGRPRTPQDKVFYDAVHCTWDPASAHAPLDEHVRTSLDAARSWFHLAYIHQFSADVGDAMELYRASIEAHKTSEAFTFLGWCFSFLKDHQSAIHECEKAIAVDPSFGNPYNDIGAYLLELGQPAPALPWFERALQAPRYQAPHFAHTNAGRALLALGRTGEARRHLEEAVQIAPGYRPAQEILKHLPPDEPRDS